ncbi:uncharacterized protein LOC143855931 [Tasmannia lanceolata]|uniref:uncharacterized protein LOC143855931 n=1 Tax=Tasmannia lanceolata TaxID=3420 RepID=UPI004064BCB4
MVVTDTRLGGGGQQEEDDKESKLGNSISLETPPNNPWMLYVDGAANVGGCVGLVLVSPDSFLVEYAIKLEFRASINEAEYEDLLSGLDLAIEMNADCLRVHSDSQLVVGQVNGQYEAKELRMMKHLERVREKLKQFRVIEVVQISRTINARADALSKMAALDITDVGTMYVEILKQPRIDREEISEIKFEPSWMDPILRYLKDGIVPDDRKKPVT